ncbi:MAG: phosphatase PAP2 family protein [Rhodobacter sp.]|nr:phosphatase PAP2 family protein [Rhodobacter sp.]MCA3512460.1 phosphatase PAP2 family protein [Rhodobacter sp.]MCA3519455.1 phosphatase PAP2 family protein [Rhodobacter sp.]MCA3523313.1 phosphatase PAP2 family protein [Rhodobacter sp.]MCA3525009.1 phosphatase PAP2 family protein [Rhodobacter sp.]
MKDLRSAEDGAAGPGAKADARARIAAVLARQDQSPLSLFICFVSALFLVVMIADGPVHTMAKSLDPTLNATLRRVTEFGNSAWPLGIGLTLLALVAVARRRAQGTAAEELRDFRSCLLLVVFSVAGSGFLASLSKNMIGRMRPSTVPDPNVLEFSVMAFRAGWASFPSGHATTAAACAVALAICAPRLSWAWLSVGLVAALSRALLGVHWLSDCLAGLALGTGFCLLVRRHMENRGHRFVLDPLVLFPALVLAVQALSGALSGLGRPVSAGLLRLWRKLASRRGT